MWQRFTERARRVVFFAQEEAGRLGENYVGTEHLLLGLVRENDSVAARILDRMGVSLGRIRSEIEGQVMRGDGRLGQDMQLTPRAKRVVDLAYDEARQLSNNYIGTEHLLLGLIREEEGLAGRVLAKLGVDLERTRREVMALQDASRESGMPPDLAIQGRIKRMKLRGAKPLSEAAPAGGDEEREGALRGSLAELKDGDRPAVELIPNWDDVAEVLEVFVIKDEFAYRELAQAGTILLLPSGTPVKLLGMTASDTAEVRALEGEHAGLTGFVMRRCLSGMRPDDRPFPPDIGE